MLASPALHQPVVVELPCSLPWRRHHWPSRSRDSGLEAERRCGCRAEAPELLPQPVVELTAPLPLQEVDDRVASLEVLAAVGHFESRVYASATRSGSRVFQASSAACTFCRAVSSVKGGTGGLISASFMVGNSSRVHGGGGAGLHCTICGSVGRDSGRPRHRGWQRHRPGGEHRAGGRRLHGRAGRPPAGTAEEAASGGGNGAVAIACDVRDPKAGRPVVRRDRRAVRPSRPALQQRGDRRTKCAAGRARARRLARRGRHQPDGDVPARSTRSG